MESEKDQNEMLPLKLSLLPNPLNEAIDDDDKTPEYPLKEGSIIMTPFFSLIHSNIRNINTPNTEYVKLEPSPRSDDTERTSSPPEIKCGKSPHLTSIEQIQLSEGGCDMPDTTANPEMSCFLDNELRWKDDEESPNSGCFSLPSVVKSDEHSSMPKEFNTFTQAPLLSDMSRILPATLKVEASPRNVETRLNERVDLSTELECTSSVVSPCSPWAFSAPSSSTSGNNKTTVSCHECANDDKTLQELHLDVQQMDCDSDYMRVWNRQHIFALDLSDKQCGSRQAFRHICTHGQLNQVQCSERNLSLLVRSLIDFPLAIPLSVVSFNKETYSSPSHKDKAQVRAASRVLGDFPSKIKNGDMNNGSNRRSTKECVTARLNKLKDEERDQIPQLTPHIPTDDQSLLPNSSFDNQPPNLSPIEPYLSTCPFSSNQSPPGAPDILVDSNKALNRSPLLPASGNSTGHTSPSTFPAGIEGLQCVVACDELTYLTPEESDSEHQPGLNGALSATSDQPAYSSSAHALLSSNIRESLAKHATVSKDSNNGGSVVGIKSCCLDIVSDNSIAESNISTATGSSSIARLDCDVDDTEHSQSRWRPVDPNTTYVSDNPMPMIGHRQSGNFPSLEPSELSVKDPTSKADYLSKACSDQNRVHTDERTNTLFPGIYMKLECSNRTGNHNKDSNIASKSKYATGIRNYARTSDYETHEAIVNRDSTSSNYLQDTPASQNVMKNAVDRLHKHNKDILVEIQSKCTKEQPGSANSKSIFTSSSHDSAIRVHQNTHDNMNRGSLTAQEVPEVRHQSSTACTPFLSSKITLHNKNVLQPPTTIAPDSPCQPVMFPYRSSHFRSNHSSTWQGVQNSGTRHSLPFEDEHVTNFLRKIAHCKTTMSQQYNLMKHRVLDRNCPSAKKRKPDILEKIDFGKHLRKVISKRENETVQAENEAVDNGTLHAESETRDYITLYAESEVSHINTLHAESEVSHINTLHAESEVSDINTLHAESETRDYRTLYAESEVSHINTLHAASEVSDINTLQDESETRDNRFPPSESKTRDNGTVQAENETRDNRTLQVENETRDNRCLQVENETRDNRTLQVENETRDNRTLQVGNETRDNRTLQVENETRDNRTLQVENETRDNRTLQVENETRDNRTIRAKSGMRENRTFQSKSGKRKNRTIPAERGTRENETVWVESGPREYRNVQAVDSEKRDSIHCPPSVGYTSYDELGNCISANRLKVKTPSFKAYKPKKKKNISKQLQGKVTRDRPAHWKDYADIRKKSDFRNTEYAEPVTWGYSRDGGQLLHDWNTHAGSADGTIVSEQSPRSERLPKEHITQDEPLDLSRENNGRHSGTAAALASYFKSCHHHLQTSRVPPYGFNSSHESKLNYCLEHSDISTSRYPSQFANSIVKNTKPSSLWRVNHPGHNLQNSPYPPPEVAASLSSIPLEFPGPVHSSPCLCCSPHTRLSSRDTNSSLMKPSIHYTVSPSLSYTPESIYRTPNTFPKVDRTPARNHYPFTVPFSTHSLPSQSCYRGANPINGPEQLPSIGYRHVNMTPTNNYGLCRSQPTSFVNATVRPLQYHKPWPHAQSNYCSTSTIRALLESKVNGSKLRNSHPPKKSRSHHYPIHAKAPYATAPSLNTVYQDSSFDAKTFLAPVTSSGQPTVARTCSAPRHEEIYECPAPTTNNIAYLSPPEMTMHSLSPRNSYSIAALKPVYPRTPGLHQSLDQPEAHSHFFAQSEPAALSANPPFRESENSETFYNDRFNFSNSRIQNEEIYPSLVDRTSENSPETFHNSPLRDADIQTNTSDRLQNNLMIDLTGGKDECSEVVSISSNDTVEETKFPFSSSILQDKVLPSEWSNIDHTRHWSKSFTSYRHADVTARGTFLPTNHAKGLEHHSVHSSFTNECSLSNRQLTYNNPLNVSSLLSTSDRVEDCYADEEEDAAVSNGIRYMDCQSNTPPQSCTTNSSDLSSPRLLNNTVHIESSTAGRIFETTDVFSEKEHCTVSRPHSLEQLYERERDDTFPSTIKVNNGHDNLSIVSPTKTSLAEKIKLVLGQRRSAPAEEMLQAPERRSQQTTDYMVSVPIDSPFDHACTTSRTLAQEEILPENRSNLGIENPASPFDTHLLPSNQNMGVEPQEEFYQETIYQIQTQIKGNADFWKDQKEHADDLTNHKPKPVSKRRKLNPKKDSTHENCQTDGIIEGVKTNLASETKPRGRKKRTQKQTRAKRFKKTIDVQVTSLSEGNPDFQSPVPDGSYGQESACLAYIHPHSHSPTSLPCVVLEDMNTNGAIPSEQFHWKLMRSPRSSGTLGAGVQRHAFSYSNPQETVYTITGAILSPQDTDVNALMGNDESMKGRPQPSRSHEEMNTASITYPCPTQMLPGSNYNSSAFLNSPHSSSYLIQSPQSNFIQLNRNYVSKNDIPIPQTQNRPGGYDNCNAYPDGQGRTEGFYDRRNISLDNLQDGIFNNSKTHIFSEGGWINEPLNTICGSGKGCVKSAEGMYPHLQTDVQSHYLHQMRQLNNQECFSYHGPKDQGFAMTLAADHSCEKRTTHGARVVIQEDT